jgi:hypothetical protein
LSCTLVGEIVATQITSYGDTSLKYGFVTVDIDTDGQIKLKVDSHTKCETLDRGERVQVVYDSLGNTGIVVAKEISLVSSSKM